MDETKTPQDQKVVAFKIWYSDYVLTGTTHKQWEEAPDDDVQVVVLYFEGTTDDHRSRLIAYGKSDYALSRNMKLNPSAVSKKVGTNIPDKKYKSILDEAYNDYGEDWILPNTVLIQMPDFGGKMIDMPEPRSTHSKNRGSK